MVQFRCLASFVRNRCGVFTHCRGSILGDLYGPELLRATQLPFTIKFSPAENLVGIQIVPSGNTRHRGPGHQRLPVGKGPGGCRVVSTHAAIEQLFTVTRKFLLCDRPSSQHFDLDSFHRQTPCSSQVLEFSARPPVGASFTRQSC